MKLNRIMGVILLVLSLSLVIKYNEEINFSNVANSISMLTGNGTVNNDVIEYDKSMLDENNNKYTNVISYTNPNGYAVTLTENNIKITCKGSGANKEKDEALVRKNFKIKARFSNSKNGKKEESIVIGKRDTAYIFITEQYDSSEYPTNEVNCSYSISIATV